MKSYPAIQKSIAILMLLVFSISIAPKAFFHDLVSDHEDSNCLEVHNSAVLHQKEHHCHFDNVVVGAPFLVLANEATEVITIYAAKEVSAYRTPSFQYFFLNKENRGPPFRNLI